MLILERDFIKSINSGKCLAIVGSGPSIDIGLPTWKKLAEDAIYLLDENTIKAKNVKFTKLIDNGDFPKIFSIIREEIGLEKLTSWIEKELEINQENGGLYNYISTWPFANYFTTNYDDILLDQLHKLGIPAVTKLNTIEDMRLLRADSKNIVFKIHGDCTDPENIVLTSEQYSEFKDGPSKYCRICGAVVCPS